MLLARTPEKFVRTKPELDNFAYETLLETDVRIQSLPAWQSDCKHPGNYPQPQSLTNIAHEGIHLPSAREIERFAIFQKYPYCSHCERKFFRKVYLEEFECSQHSMFVDRTHATYAFRLTTLTFDLPSLASFQRNITMANQRGNACTWIATSRKSGMN